tara:strand:+ start:352 stop:2112 length:1761 start_codon:yes stop_codon:yes gene_type:complete
MKIKQFIILIYILVFFSTCIEQGQLKVNTVVQHISSQPDGLHPCNNNSATRSFIFNYTQKLLTGIDLESLETIPILVDSLPEISKDGLKYTYRIKKGIKWDDGEEFTAKDVEFSTKIMLCPLTDNTQIRSNYSTVIKSIEIFPKDPYKFVMHAKKVHVNNKTIMGGIYMQQKSHWDPDSLLDNISFNDIHNKEWKPSKDIDDWFVKFNNPNNSYQEDKLVGLGAYQVSEFKTGQYIILNKKENWWGKHDTDFKYNTAYPDKIIFKIIKEDASVYFALKNQRLDVSTYISTKKFIDLKDSIKNPDFNKNYHADFIDRYAYNYIGLNMRPDGKEHKKYFTEQKVRRAMAHLVPADRIIEVIYYGHASRQVAQISPLKKTYNKELELIPLDIEKAKSLLDEAGWIDTDGDNIRDKIVDGEKLQLSFNFNYMHSPLSQQIALMIKESMQQAGVDAKLSPMDFSIFYERAQNHKFDAMLGGWSGSASYSDPMQIWHTSSWVNKGSNFVGFGDAESDALIQKANTSIDPNEHKEALLALQEKIYHDQPYIFLLSSKNKIAIHKRFKNANMYKERPGVMLNNLLFQETTTNAE